MLLAIDAGNTNIVFGVYEEDRWIQRWRIRTVPDKMPDEYGVLFRDLLDRERIDIGRVDRAVMGSVVPPLTDNLVKMVYQLIQKKPMVLSSGIRTGIRIRTDNPVELGSDLVANAVAAYTHFQGNCIVVDFGTALTFTAVQEPGDLLGVAIAPGLVSAADALSRRTAQLPLVQLVPPKSAIGRNTVQSIQSGILFGYVGMVEGLIDRIRRELVGEVKVIATGDFAESIASLTDYFNVIEPWLTLEGLRIIADRNRPKSEASLEKNWR